MNRAVILAGALLLSGCAGPHLSLFGGKAPAASPPPPAVAPKPVCTPDEAAPVDPAPDPRGPAYVGLRFVMPFASDPEELKAGAQVMLAFVHDVLDYANKAHDRLQRTSATCAATPTF